MVTARQKSYFKRKAASAYGARTSKSFKKTTLSSLRRTISEAPELPTKASEKVGHYNPVMASQTTLSRCLGPFSGKKFVELVYEHLPSLQTTTAPGSFLTVMSNGAFDFDVTNGLGNKQPRFYDTLLTASGPYKSYKVISWRTVWTFINVGAYPTNIAVSPPITASSEYDSMSEALAWPGSKYVTLTPSDGSRSSATITTTGHVRDCYPALPFSTTLVAAFSANPTGAPCYQNVVYANADGTNVTALYVGVKHIMYTEMGQEDALES